MSLSVAINKLTLRFFSEEKAKLVQTIFVFVCCLQNALSTSLITPYTCIFKTMKYIFWWCNTVQNCWRETVFHSKICCYKMNELL